MEHGQSWGASAYRTIRTVLHYRNRALGFTPQSTFISGRGNASCRHPARGEARFEESEITEASRWPWDEWNQSEPRIPLAIEGEREPGRAVVETAGAS
jgi:hypothetical protein